MLKILRSLRRNAEQARGDHASEVPCSQSLQGWALLQSDAPTAQDLIRERRLVEAEALLKRQLLMQPTNRQVLTQLAQLSELHGNWDEACKWWSSITVEKIRRWEVEVHLVRVMARQGRRQPAKQMLLRLLREHENNSGIIVASTNLIEEFDPPDRNEFAPLLAELVDAHEKKHGDSAQTLQARSKIAMLDERWQEAFQCIRQALLIRPQDQHLQHLVAEAAKRAGVAPESASEAHPTRTDADR